MEYGLIFHGTCTVKYYCKNMKYRINIAYYTSKSGIWLDISRLIHYSRRRTGFKYDKVLPAVIGFYDDKNPYPKRCIIPSSLNNCIEVLLLMLLIAQIVIILRSEPMKIKRQFQRDI